MLEFFLNQPVFIKETNAKESDYEKELSFYPESGGEYDSGTVFKVKDDLGVRIFESLGKSRERPSKTSKYWAYKGMTNPYKMVDEFLNTKTEVEDELVFTIDASYTNILGFFRCEAEKIKIEIIYDDEVKAIYERDLIRESITNIYEYLANEVELIHDFVMYIGYQLYGAKARITLTRQNNIAKLGRVTKGIKYHLGETLWGAKNSFLDFSYIQRDEDFGTVNMVRGNWAKRTDVSVVVDTAKYDLAMTRINQMLGKECIFILSEDYETLLIYGFLKEHETILKNPSKSYIDLTIEGMI